MSTSRTIAAIARTPDIVGVDDSARARIVIEAKVDAGFQPGQIARPPSEKLVEHV